MLETALVLVLLFVCVLVCAAFCGVGFFLGVKVNFLYRPKKPPDEDEKAKIKQKQAKCELENFYNYTGDKQE